MRTGKWTDDEVEYLRDRYGKDTFVEIAARLGRPWTAVKSTAKRMGISERRRHYTDEEIRIVNDLWPTHTAAEIAEQLGGRSRSAVFQIARRLGLERKTAPLPADAVARIPELHAQGLSDQQIAAATGICRRYVTVLRRDRFGLPVNAKAVLEARQRGVKTQLARLGVRNTAELRALKYRHFAAENGWPESMRPREVQILNVLATQGPKTMMELAKTIGMRIDRRNTSHGGPVLLTDSGRDGTYTSSLIKQGLVVYLHRSQPSGRRGIGRLPGIYMLTAEAIAIREQMLAKNGGVKRHDARRTHRGGATDGREGRRQARSQAGLATA